MVVRRARTGDEGVLRALRIAALSDAPTAFASTLEREQARTPADWRRWLSPGVTYLAIESSGQAVGLVAGLLAPEPDVADLVSLWVHPDVRGTGVADDLVRALVAWSDSQHRRLRLHVVDGNAPAMALYARHLFRATGEVTVRGDGVVEHVLTRDAPVAPSPGLER